MLPLLPPARNLHHRRRADLRLPRGTDNPSERLLPFLLLACSLLLTSCLGAPPGGPEEPAIPPAAPGVTPLQPVEEQEEDEAMPSLDAFDENE